MNSNTNEFAKYLEKKMSDRNISVNKLSEQLNLDKSYIYKWLKSERRPSARKDHINLIAKILHLSALETRELREAFYLSIEGSESVEKKSLVSSILKGLSFKMDITHQYFDVNHKSPIYSNGKDYFIINKNSMHSLMNMLLDEIENFSAKEELYISISFSKLFEEQAFGSFVNLIKLILNKGVNIVHVVTLKKDALYNLKIFNTLLPLILLNSSGKYVLKYFTQYDSMFFPEIIYTPRFSAMLMSSGIVVFKDSPASEMIKSEFENFSNFHTLPFIDEVSEDEFYEGVLPECLNSRGVVYSLMGLKHIKLLDETTNQNSKTKIYKIFLENEVYDCIEQKTIDDNEQFKTINDLKTYINDTHTSDNTEQLTLLVDENIYSSTLPVYSLLKKGTFLILCIYPSDSLNSGKNQIILKITEKTIIDIFDNFYSNILYKYSES